jgi:hypothetical protein
MHPRTSEILDYLDAQRQALRTAFGAVPPAFRERVPAPGRWSPAGIVEHLSIVEARVADRMTSRLNEARVEGIAAETSTEPLLPTLNLAGVVDRRIRIEAPEIARPTGLGAEAAWDALQRAGEEVRKVLRSADGLALSTISMPHPALGSLTLYQYFAFTGAHEARHAEQMREIAEAAATEVEARQSARLPR